MRHTQSAANRINTRRRQNTASRLNFGRFLTTLGVGVVLVLLGATFLGDYLRVPKLAASASPLFISPNGDQTQDAATLTYSISDEAGVLIEVVDRNGQVVRSLDAIDQQPAGQYVVTWDGRANDGQPVADGRYLLRVSAAGVARSVAQSAEVWVDTQPPILRLTNLDDVTRVASPGLAIEGVTETGSTVYQAGAAQPIAVDANGAFKLERQLTEGPNILEILASDQAGNTARTSHEVTLVTHPPELTLITPTNDQWFKDTVLEVTGAVPPGTTVKVNGQAVTVQEEEGSFNREVILQEGDNTLRVEATDDVGNVTVQERLVHLKTRPPALTLSIEDGTVLQQSSVQLTGRTDSGSTILINNQLVAVSALGEFQTTLNLMNGKNTVNVEARDLAGNITTLSRQVTFESPVAQNEVTRFLNGFPPLSTLALPLAIVLPSLLLLAYLFTRPVSMMLATDKETFIPGLPEEGTVVTLTLDLSRNARTSIEVLSQFNRPVTTISPRRERSAGLHTFYWDGYDEFGHVLPAGDYILKAIANTPGGTVSSAVPLTIYEDPLAHAQYGRSTQSAVVEEAQARVVRRTRR